MSDPHINPYAARGSRTPCPECGLVGTMTILHELKITGTDEEGNINFSLAGVQAKLTAEVVYYIICGADDIKGCGWKEYGEIEGGLSGTHFVIRTLKKRDNS